MTGVGPGLQQHTGRVGDEGTFYVDRWHVGNWAL